VAHLSLCAALLAIAATPGSVGAQETVSLQAATAAVDEAEAVRERARDVDAHKRTPLTYDVADSLFSEAKERLENDPPDSEEASRLAAAAAQGFAHAERLAPLADSIHGRDLSGEEVLLRREAYLAEISAALALSPDFEAGLDATSQLVLAGAAATEAERSRLERELADRSDRVSELEARLDSVEARLADVEEREAAATAELARREALERRLREVRAVFDPDEAEVLVTDDRVTVRLAGLSFPSGSADLGPDDAPLLTKLERVVRDFPGARITVEGHTDNVGDDATNLALSQRRAIAVRDYLLTGVAMSADRISAVGYGKTRPIAPNDTAEGRRRNRRIDVTIDITG
jgi:outer membrane protein OmpA-like peptidoglycan-associated protein